MNKPMSFEDELERKWAESDRRMEEARLKKERERAEEEERRIAGERREALQKADFQKKIEMERAERVRQRKLLATMPAYVLNAPEDINETKKKPSFFDRFIKKQDNEPKNKNVKTRSELMSRVIRIRNEAKSDSGLVLGVTRPDGHQDTGIGVMIATTLSEDCQKDKDINTSIFAEITDVTKQTSPASVVNSLTGMERAYMPCIDAIEHASAVIEKRYGTGTFVESIDVYNEDGSENRINGIPPTLRIGRRDKSVRAVPPELSEKFVKAFSRKTPLVIGTNEARPAYVNSTVLPAVTQKGMVDGIVVEITVSEVEEDFPDKLRIILDKYEDTELFFLLYLPAGEDFLKPIATRTARDILDAGVSRSRVSYITRKCHPEKHSENQENRYLARSIVDSLLGDITEEDKEYLP